MELHFNRSLKLAFRASAFNPDYGLRLYRHLDDALSRSDFELPFQPTERLF